MTLSNLSDIFNQDIERHSQAETDYKGYVFESTLPLKSAYPIYNVRLGTNDIKNRM